LEEKPCEKKLTKRIGLLTHLILIQKKSTPWKALKIIEEKNDHFYYYVSILKGNNFVKEPPKIPSNFTFFLNYKH
jgi:hypothetical protein